MPRNVHVAGQRVMQHDDLQLVCACNGKGMLAFFSSLPLPHIRAACQAESSGVLGHDLIHYQLRWRPQVGALHNSLDHQHHTLSCITPCQSWINHFANQSQMQQIMKFDRHMEQHDPLRVKEVGQLGVYLEDALARLQPILSDIIWQSVRLLVLGRDGLEAYNQGQQQLDESVLLIRPVHELREHMEQCCCQFLRLCCPRLQAWEVYITAGVHAQLEFTELVLYPMVLSRMCFAQVHKQCVTEGLKTNQSSNMSTHASMLIINSGRPIHLRWYNAYMYEKNTMRDSTTTR